MPDFTPGTTCWEKVQDDKWTSVDRMPVPSGWLYKVRDADDFRLSFVPAPAAIADAERGGAEVERGGVAEVTDAMVEAAVAIYVIHVGDMRDSMRDALAAAMKARRS